MHMSVVYECLVVLSCTWRHLTQACLVAKAHEAPLQSKNMLMIWNVGAGKNAIEFVMQITSGDEIDTALFSDTCEFNLRGGRGIGATSCKVSFDAAITVLNGDVGSGVEERRRGDGIFAARPISVRDLYERTLNDLQAWIEDLSNPLQEMRARPCQNFLSSQFSPSDEFATNRGTSFRTLGVQAGGCPDTNSSENPFRSILGECKKQRFFLLNRAREGPVFGPRRQGQNPVEHDCCWIKYLI